MQSLPYPRYRMEEIWKEGFLTGWEELREQTREHVRYLINNSILSELESFLGCGKYERVEERKSYRNGYYERLIGTSLGKSFFEPSSRNLSIKGGVLQETVLRPHH